MTGDADSIMSDLCKYDWVGILSHQELRLYLAYATKTFGKNPYDRAVDVQKTSRIHPSDIGKVQKRLEKLKFIRRFGGGDSFFALPVPSLQQHQWDLPHAAENKYRRTSKPSAETTSAAAADSSRSESPVPATTSAPGGSFLNAHREEANAPPSAKRLTFGKSPKPLGETPKTFGESPSLARALRDILPSSSVIPSPSPIPSSSVMGGAGGLATEDDGALALAKAGMTEERARRTALAKGNAWSLAAVQYMGLRSDITNGGAFLFALATRGVSTERIEQLIRELPQRKEIALDMQRQRSLAAEKSTHNACAAGAISGLVEQVGKTPKTPKDTSAERARQLKALAEYSHEGVSQ